MNISQFNTNIKSSWQLIDSLSIGLTFTPYPNQPESPASFFREKTYREIWEEYYKNNFYHIKLADHSLLYFSYRREDKKWEASYSFIQCPFDCKTYQDFLIDKGLNIEDYGDSFISDYEQYLFETRTKMSFTPIRYDYHPTQYKPGLHPASHIHIGFANSVRICLSKLLSPISFTHFILRQAYPKNWLAFMSENHELVNIEKSRFGNVHNSMFNGVDKSELFLM